MLRTTKPLTFITLCVLISFNFVYAQNTIFKWVDDNGITHYTDSELKVPSKYQNKTEEIKFRKKKNRARYNSNDTEEEIRNEENYTASDSQEIKIPFTDREGSSGRIIVDVTINDSITVPMAIDTGAPGLILSFELANRLGIINNNDGVLISQTRGIGGNTLTIRTIIDSVKIGEAKEKIVPAKILGEISNSFDGLIGMDFLENYSFRIDNEENYLYLGKKNKNNDMPSGHNKQWWKKTFKEFQFYESEWKNVYQKLKKDAKNTLVNSSLTGNRLKDLTEFARYQHKESQKLLRRLEQYARKHSVPQSWKR